MSNYKSLIDEAMRTAKYRLNAGVDKTASAPNDSSLIKEASELANALEYMSVASVSEDNNSLVGQARAEIVRDFYKSATSQRLGVKLAGDVGESSTHVEGEQNIAPQHGKTKLAPKKESGGNPLVSAAPDSQGKTMLESYKQAGSSLYDILMHQKEAKARPAVSEEEMSRAKNYGTVGNLVPVPLVGGGTVGAAIGAPEGRKMDAAIGSMGGQIAGGLGGAVAGGLGGAALGALGGREMAAASGLLGGMAGSIGGGLYGQRKGIEHMLRKEAGDVGEMDASMPAPGIPSSNENSNRSILQDAYVLQGVSKQEAKAPVRARLAEAFAGASDTLGDKTVKAMFPNAYQKGGLKKTAMSRNEQIDEAKNRASMGTVGRRLVGAAVPVAGLVPAATLAAGHGVEDADLKSKIQGRTFLGGTAGSILGGIPGAAMAAPHLVAGNVRKAIPGLALSALGGTAGEIAGQRMALNQLKEASATDVRSRLLSMVND